MKKERIDGLSRFLCPVGLQELNLQGGISSDNFEYVKIKVNGCQVEPCKPKELIAEQTVSFAMIKTQPNTFAKLH